jgi:hypothetical protein
VEVKSTGRHGFQEFKAKDLLANTLVWIHFGKRLNKHGAIQIVILDSGNISSNPCVSTFQDVRKVGDFRLAAA